eukprot:TRINITY_DN69_c0_g1_i2.p1 TRINITY_DN69_c0_g1~~TRINITY_DN69_c0_g1_i2.p1  ORF type:complete len:308 (+),score=-50.79 TRINITY_DN69_c0_g1_i2:1141-2064(+)
MSHDWILKCLEFHGFSSKFRHLIELCLNNNQTYYDKNSDPFYIKRGRRQGDPMFPYLFIIALDWLLVEIDQSRIIKGVKIGTEENKVEAFADDLTILLSIVEEVRYSANKVFEILEYFTKISGLEVNVEKSKFIGHNVGYLKDIGLEKVPVLKVIGSFISIDEVDRTENKRMILEKLKYTSSTLSSFLSMNLPARVCVWNTLIIPKVIHLLRSTAYCEDLTLEVQEIESRFLFKDKPNKIFTRRRIALSKKWGGLGMVCFKNYWKYLLFGWFRRILDDTTVWGKIVLQNLQNKIGVTKEDIEGFGHV